MCKYVYVCVYVFLGSETSSAKERLPFIEGSVLEGYFIIVEIRS